jgi:serine/threonine protein kinase/uncharacterized membrane protein
MEANFRVGQYVLERPLGIGGMAEVWLARNAYLGTPAAIKFLNQGYAGMTEIEQRFLNEGKRQGGLNHPNIIKVYGFEYVDNRSFLILQYIDGESLDQVLHRAGRLDTSEAMRIAISVLNALDYAHEHNIVHRDIKPSNILLDENRIPYLGDFGIVLATNEKRITRAGTAMGTALYMSPEQITDPGSVDRRADIYSIGCVIYEMLAGQPPFNPPSSGTGDTDFAVKMAHVQQAPPALRRWNPALSPELEAAVMRCLAKNPAERYRTCREVRDALSTAMVSRPYVSPQMAPQPQMQQPPMGVPPRMGVPTVAAPPAMYPPVHHPMAVPAAPPLMYVPPPAQKRSRGPLIAGGAIALIALIVILVIALKPKTPETPIETDLQRQVRLQQEALKAQQQKEEQARLEKEQRERQAKEAEQSEISRSEADETAFAQTQAQLMQGLNGNYHSITFHNNCAKADILVASTYMDLQGNWVTHGWWKVKSLGTLDPNLYSRSPVFYFYAHSVNPDLVWNTGDSTIDATVVGNRFMHKMASPALGSDKRTVKMFKSAYADQYGRHSQSFTCSS